MIAIRNYHYYEIRDNVTVIDVKIQPGDEFEEGEYNGDGYLEPHIINYLETEGILVSNGD